MRYSVVDDVFLFCQTWSLFSGGKTRRKIQISKIPFHFMKPLDFFQNRTFIESSISLLYCMITNWIILNNFQVNTCPIDRKAFKAIIIYNRLGGNEISREAIKEKISTNDENVVYDDTTLCEICGCGDRGESLLLCDGTVQFITSVCAKICKKIFWSDPIYSFFMLLIFVCFFYNHHSPNIW